MASGNTTPSPRSRWLTFDLECSLRRLADGDWIGNEEAATFTPYQRGRRRY
jgi:hypothetical protein